MADKTQTELQQLVNDAASDFWALEQMIYGVGDPIMTALAERLHAKAAGMVLCAGCDLPVQPKSGGGGK